jgi:chemotaxis signal transduction protein
MAAIISSPSEAHSVDDFIPVMRNVAKCATQLSELNFTWGLIEATAKMNCPTEAKTILPTMAATREGFGKLETQLIENLVEENFNKVLLEVGSKAQVVVDIVIRNLYERTADVGFLATDDDIRRFIQAAGSEMSTGEAIVELRRITRRLAEYRDKYTVYEEIMILDTAGKVLAHLDESNPVSASSDPLIQQALVSDSYVETFHATDLRPHLPRALIYSRKIEDADSDRPIGVLCLCFRFENEMEGIFNSLKSKGDKSVMLLLDKDGTVIASSDEDHVHLGRKLEMVLDEPYRIVDFAGREYLAKTCATTGYQGYMGPGWFGHVMVPVASAFRQPNSHSLDAIDKGILAGVMAHTGSFCPALNDIAKGADKINLSLRRVVWNGQIMAAGKHGDLLKLKSILQQISETGDRTSSVFANSIRDLYETVISSSLQDVQFISRLMIDIMDRNLYERANDCRWWALASDIRRIMAKSSHDEEDQRKISAILEYINGLYTVYTRLFVYDTAGTIIAASNLHRDGISPVGKKIDSAFLPQVLALQTTQHYCVSPFEDTWLYGGQATYIYNAAIRYPDESSRVVGGIGIVFDSSPEFHAMLAGSLPKQEGAFALFTERSGRIIASTSPSFPINQRLPLDKAFFSLPNGDGMSKIVSLRGHYYAVGCTTSFGYREYKNSGDYQNDILAFVFVPLGQEISEGETSKAAPPSLNHSHNKGGDVVELATFLVAGKLYGIPAADVVEAVDPGRLSPITGSRRYLCGMITFHGNNAEDSGIVPVINLRILFEAEHKDPDQHSQIVIIRSSEGLLGLMVDDLYAVPEFDAARLEVLPDSFKSDAGYVGSIIKPMDDDKDRILPIIDPNRIFKAAQKKG